MPDLPVSQDIDDFMQSADDAAARSELGLGSAATSNTGDFATSIQGGKADTALQSGANISELTNNAGYITSAPVDSVNSQVGTVLLDADDIADAATTNKFATQIELNKANSALQSGDNVSALNNDAGYLTTAPAAPVDSVNTQTGAVVLDADDISDSATTNKFATQAELDKANSSLQSLVAGTNITIDATNPTSPTINSSGGGAVDSVNTQTGVVVLDADDISDATTTNKFATQAQLDNADSALQSGDNITELANNAGYITSAPVDSVNGNTGTVVLDADDIDDSLTTHKFATQAQLDNADSALQSGDNISELTNNSGYITSAPVDSVNTQTGAVVLDADDIDDSATTNKFATQAQLDKADTALQPSDPTLDSVTTNGATTNNDVNLGRITTGSNTALGANAVAIGGTGNAASGLSCEVLGGDGSTASGQGSTVVGGSGHTNSGNWSATLGGLNHTVTSVRGNILGGATNTLQHNDSCIIACNNKTSVATSTLHTENLHLFDGFKMPTGATANYVLTSDANGVGTWQAGGGGGGGSSVVKSYVDNSFTITKPTSADVITSVTGLSYQMTSGTTYYIKVFVLSETSIGNDVEYIYLSHTPWANTAGIKEGLVGTHWNDEGISTTGGSYGSGTTQYGGSWYEQSASRHHASFFSPYAGFSEIEGYITAPSTATFTPTISYLGTPTGTIDVRVQGMIMEMP